MRKVTEKKIINPKAEEMCEIEKKYNTKCTDCPGDILDQQWCKQNQINWNITKIVKGLDDVCMKLNLLLERLNK